MERFRCRIDRAGRTAEVPEDPVNDRRLLDDVAVWRKSQYITPTRPLGRAAGVGVSAGTVGSALTPSGALQVVPHSVDEASAIALLAPLVIWASCHIACRVPTTGPGS